MRIVLVGTGNTATILGRKMKEAGQEIVQVYGRSTVPARKLAGQLETAFTTSLAQLDPTADVYIIAVADAAIPEVIKNWPLKDKLLVHTAGSVSREVLKGASSRYGICYPLQSLRREMTQLPDIPFLVDANTPDDIELLTALAARIASRVGRAGDEQRLKLHVAAVMVSNFTNHLYTLAERYCKAEQVDFSLLHPLIAEVAERLQYMSPWASQTGPAIRKDTPTIEKHLELLQDHGELKELYAWFTKSIQGR